MKYTFCLLTIFMASMLSLNAQIRVYTPYFEVINMHADYPYASTKLFKTYVDNNGKYQLVLPDKNDSSKRNDAFSQIKQTAADLKCPQFIIGELNRLGEMVIVTISLYSSNDGRKLWSKVSKALTPDDIDPIMENMAKNLGDNHPDRNGDLDDVTAYESREKNRVGANRYFGFTIGGGIANMPSVERNFPAGFGAIGSYDMRNMIFNIKGEAYFSDVDVYYLNIEALYPLKHKKNSPFISGAMGYGGVAAKNNINGTIYELKNRASGLFLFAGGGYLLNRNSDVPLRFACNLFMPAFKVNDHVPAGVLISTTILFGR